MPLLQITRIRHFCANAVRVRSSDGKFRIVRIGSTQPPGIRPNRSRTACHRGHAGEAGAGRKERCRSADGTGRVRVTGAEGQEANRGIDADARWRNIVAPDGIRRRDGQGTQGSGSAGRVHQAARGRRHADAGGQPQGTECAGGSIQEENRGRASSGRKVTSRRVSGQDRATECPILREEAEQRQAQIALQNQRLMQEEEPPRSWPEQRKVPLLPAGDAFDTDELRLCHLLEQKAAETGYDIAEINLLTAKGLPGAENLDVDRSLKTLDLWAAWVRHETDRHLYKFREAPEEYSRSEAYFHALMMICTLQEDFHVCYNRDPKMRSGPVEVVPSDLTFFGNPKDLFVHGLTGGAHEGTCASLPVLYVAIGRRLGYPLKLVECKGHLFARWEDDKERFNIEGTNRGLNCYPDQEYLEWPYPISKEELATGMYMTSLSPKRELAAFLELRALCLKQNGLHGRA